MPPSVVLAIDPGRAKCGVAAVNSTGAVLHRAIVLTPDLSAALADLAARFAPCVVLVGDGTYSAPVRASLEALALGAPVVPVDERHTSEAARARYVAEVPARGWRRLMPRALRYPETPYDDFVAVILAERWWRERESED